MSYPFDLGPWRRDVTTQNPEAQLWFDRGLNWLYAYNHEEAVTCFRHALEHDPACAMAHWGIAAAAGPFYNRPWIRFTVTEIEATLPVCHAAACEAQAHAEGGTPEERALIRAIGARYPAEMTTDLAVLNEGQNTFAGAMRKVHQAFPEDPDIAAIFVEAVVTCTPRQLWDLRKGVPKETSGVAEALEVLERALARHPDHPGLCHMHIHALEMAPFPERALVSADRLRGAMVDAGHMEHMPAHIDVLVGDYAQAVAQSQRAVRADDLYRDHAGVQNFYTTARCHDLHLMMYAAMFLGQERVALEAADRIDAEATDDLIEWSPPFMSAILDGYSAMRVHVLVRFGRWREITRRPAPDPKATPIRAAMHAYGRGVAFAALKDFEGAHAARRRFREIRGGIDPEAVFLSNPIVAMLGVGEAMMEGELAYHEGAHEEGFGWLREAVARDDALNYTEPWAWMHPPRHALGALLAEQGQFEEAERVYREDLGLWPGVPRCCQHPDNVWALHGLLECVERREDGPEAAHLRQRLTLAQARADRPIRAACCCRRMM